jgi:dephospho-CoA kinase
MNKLLCIVGMCGAGKSMIADALVERGFVFFRFGQITLDIVKERGLPLTEASEKMVREGVRAEHGMGAYAILNKPKIEKLIKEGHVVGDGLYSWDEYKILDQAYGKSLIVIAVYAPPELRYERISKRISDAQDTQLRHRPFSKEQAIQRDYAELENSDKGGPIAMADFTLVNTGTKEELLQQFTLMMDRLHL